jgi:hypothetical protein
MSARYIVRERTSRWGVRFGVFDTALKSWPAYINGRRIAQETDDRAACEADALWLNEVRP